jgi:hypothetical protein
MLMELLRKYHLLMLVTAMVKLCVRLGRIVLL